MKKRKSGCPCEQDAEDSFCSPAASGKRPPPSIVVPLRRRRERVSAVRQEASPYRDFEDDLSSEEKPPIRQSVCSKPKKACLSRRPLKEGPNSSYIIKTAPGAYEIIIGGLSGPLYARLLRKNIEAYESLFFKEGCHLMDSEGLRNKLVANIQMTRNMFRKDLDLWIACLLNHPQMHYLHFELMQYLRNKSNQWIFQYTSSDIPLETSKPFLSYRYTTNKVGGNPYDEFKKSKLLIYTGTVIVLLINCIFIELCDPDTFREVLVHLIESVLAEPDSDSF